MRRRHQRRVFGRAEETQIGPRCAIERRHGAYLDGGIADEFSADGIRDRRSGEGDCALTAVVLSSHVRDHSVGGFGRVTPAGAEGAPAFVTGTAGAFVARKRETALSVRSKFLSADAMTDWPGSLMMIMA
jgi:hypothetical protein